MSALTLDCKENRAPAHDDAPYDLWVNLKDRIKQAREAATLNKSELAKKCGVDPSAINKLESGSTKSLSGELLLKMSDALSVDPHWLAYGKPKTQSNALKVSTLIFLLTIYVSRLTIGTSHQHTGRRYATPSKRRASKCRTGTQGRSTEIDLCAIGQQTEPASTVRNDRGWLR